MKTSFVIVGLALLLFAAVPPATAQVAQQFGGTNKCVKACDPLALNGGSAKSGNDSVFVVMFGHFGDVNLVAPLTTFAPDPGKEPDRGTEVSPCVIGRTGTPLDTNIGACDFRMQSAIQVPGPNGTMYTQGGLGQNTSVTSDTITLYVTLGTIGPSPNVGVYARVETPKFPYGRQILAESDRQDASTRKTLVATPGDAYAYWEYEVKLKVRQPILPADGGFVVMFRVFQVDESAGTIQSPGWSLRYGAKFPPRIVFETKAPLVSDLVRLNTWKQSLFVRWSFTSAIGNYDVYDPGLTLRQKAGPAIVPDRIKLAALHRSPDHDGAQKPVNATWQIDYGAEPLADGHYEFVASATNLQRTYLVEETAAFDVEGAQAKVSDLGPFAPAKSPGAGLLLGAGALTVALVWLRRRPEP